MSVEETRARLSQRIRKAITESDIAFSTAQRGQVDQLVNQVTDAVLLEFDALLGSMMRSGQFQPGQQGATPPLAQAQTPAATTAQAGVPAEEVLWEGRPFLSIGELYVVTSQRVRLINGLIGKDQEDIELIRILDVDHTQGISERLLNIGDVRLRSTDKSKPDVVLRNVTDPAAVHEIIRRAILESRRQYPFAFRQEI
jgi:hypothetical protein